MQAIWSVISLLGIPVTSALPLHQHIKTKIKHLFRISMDYFEN
jgi:hypothetical protein